MTNRTTFFSLLIAAMIFVPFTTNAQVTIGSGHAPSEWSLLYLCTYYQQKGLHNARMDTYQRDALMRAGYPCDDARRDAGGLMIFNNHPDVNCLEFWNGERWISLCKDRLPTLTVNPYVLYFTSGGGEQIVTVTTNLPRWTITSTLPDWITVLQTGNQLTVTAAGNTGANAPQRTAAIRVTAGTLYEYITVIQQGTGTGRPLETAFVGAFWRNRQDGERLIRISHATNNDWTAVASHDWIILDTEQSADINVWTADAARMYYDENDLAFRLNPATASSAVRGSGNEIYFRIGLTGRLPEGAAPRFGRVIVTHNNNTESHIIWIRQGDEAHYVMTGRPNAVRWSPFNLTAPGIDIGNNVEIPARTNAAIPNPYIFFTRYPSQAGAFFQWASSSQPRMAWSPLGGVTNWGNAIGGTWDSVNIDDAHETCPPGWRRPGGVTNSFVAVNSDWGNNCEIRSSLWADLGERNANSVWGFYADGFFDRRPITSSVTGHSNSTVVGGTNNVDVAHIGRLFFNSDTDYHLFLPAAGMRRHQWHSVDVNHIAYVGHHGYYWSSSAADERITPSAWASWFRNLDNTIISGSSTTGGTQRMHGFSIRCVVDE